MGLGQVVPLPRRPSTIDQHGVAGNERCCRRSQEYDRAGHVHGLADAMQRRNALDHIRTESRVGERFLRARCMDESRRDGVHRDVVLAPFDREAFGQVRDGGVSTGDCVKTKSESSAEVTGPRMFLSGATRPASRTGVHYRPASASAFSEPP